MSRRLALGAAALLVAGAACENRQVHAFSAWAYDPAHKCLEAPAVVDVLSGPDNGPCKQVRCWESQGHEVYVTNTACDAPPDFDNETSQKTGICAVALDLFGRANHGECADAGSGSGGAPFVSSQTP